MQSEVSYQVVTSRDGKAIAGLCRDGAAVFRPVHEVISRGRCGSHGASFPIGIEAIAACGAAVARIGVGGNVIALGLELGHVCRRFSYDKGIGGIGTDLRSVLSPAQESVTRCRCCRQSAGLTVSVSAATCHSSAVARVSSSGDGELLLCKVGHQGAVASHCEGVIGIGGDHVAVLRPVGEGVTRVCRGLYGALLALLVCAAASDGATVARVSRHGDGVILLLGLEVGHQGAVASDCKGVIGLGGDHIAVLCPVGEREAVVGRCRDSA